LSEDISFLLRLFKDAVQTVSFVSPQVARGRNVVKVEFGKREEGILKKISKENRISKKYKSNKEK
jgi:hypothetical protein